MIEKNEYHEREFEKCGPQLHDEANSDAATPMGEDAATLEKEFGSNSEAQRLQGIVQLSTTIEYHLTPPAMIAP